MRATAVLRQSDMLHPGPGRPHVGARERCRVRQSSIRCLSDSERGDEAPVSGPVRTEKSHINESDGARPAGLRVLVVEDEALVALELEDLLGELGVEVVGMALNADEAVRLAGALQPDFVTMDIRLQGDRDGIAAAAEIWALYGIRSVLVSAYSEALTLARASPANPIDLVPKPIGKARLAAVLAKLRG